MQKQSTHELEQRFVEDLYDIAKGHVEALGLPLSGHFSHLNDPLIRWLDFNLRYIEPKPRRVVFSNKFPISNLSTGVADALRRIQSMFEEGKDINPYQGKGMSLYHDPSGKRRATRTDLLWADWGMWHLHLNDAEIPEGEYYAPRSDWLLFCYVFDDGVAFVDVRQHDESGVFEEGGLIETAIRSWPPLFEESRLKSVIGVESGSTTPRSADDTRDLRQGGVQGLLSVDGNVYMPPGGGLTTASTPTRVSLLRNDLVRYVKVLAGLVADPNGPWNEAHQIAPDETFRLVLTPRGLSLYGEKQDGAWVIAETATDETHWATILRRQMSPQWLLERYFGTRRRKPGTF